MRKVRNQNHTTTNSSLLTAHPTIVCAQGVEQIVSDHMSREARVVQESKYDDQELRAMQRSPKVSRATGSFFSILMQQLVWGNYHGQQ